MTRNDHDTNGLGTPRRELLESTAETGSLRKVEQPASDGDTDGVADSVGSTTRRTLMATASALGLESLAGCAGLVTGEAAQFHAPPAVLPLPPLEERRENLLWLEMSPVRMLEASGTVKRFGLARDFLATMWGATYRFKTDCEDIPTLGQSAGEVPCTDGEANLGEVILLSVPKAEVGGQSLNPLAELTSEEILKRLGGGGSASAGEQDGDGVMRGLSVNLNQPGPVVQSGYGGDLEAVSDISLLEGADELAASDEEPMRFTATARQGGSEAPIKGTLQRFEVDESLVFAAVWSYQREQTDSMPPTGLIPEGAATGNTIQRVTVSESKPVGMNIIPTGDTGDCAEFSDCKDACIRKYLRPDPPSYDLYHRCVGDCRDDYDTFPCAPSVILAPEETLRLRVKDGDRVTCPGDGGFCIARAVEAYAKQQVALEPLDIDLRATPPILPLSPLKERREGKGSWWALRSLNRVRATGTRGDKEATLTGWGSAYRREDLCSREGLRGEILCEEGEDVGLLSEKFAATVPEFGQGDGESPLASLSLRQLLGSLGTDGEDAVLGHRETELEGASIVGAAYGGEIDELTDIEVGDAGGGNLQEAMEVPAVFAAQARLRNGAETRIAGTVERAMLDSIDLVEVRWSPVPGSADIGAVSRETIPRLGRRVREDVQVSDNFKQVFPGPQIWFGCREREIEWCKKTEGCACLNPGYGYGGCYNGCENDPDTPDPEWWCKQLCDMYGDDCEHCYPTLKKANIAWPCDVYYQPLNVCLEDIVVRQAREEWPTK